MQIHFLDAPDSNTLGKLIQQVADQQEVKSLLILACDADPLHAATLDPVLRACPKPIFGGIFPQILHGPNAMASGALVVGLPWQAESRVIQGLSDPNADYFESILSHFGSMDTAEQTMFVFVDGLSTRITGLIDALFNCLGLLPKYIGGGAGSLSFQQRPCLFTNLGLIQDAAVLGLVNTHSSIGVAHGWTPISDAFKVTEADRNTVISLNWQPAFEVYKKIVEAHSGRSFSKEPFFELAKSYPLGFAKLDAEMIVRDPIILDGTRMVCVGEVAEGSHMHILNGNLDSLVAGAAHARELADAGMPHEPRRNSETAPTSLMFFVDCISRVLYLEKEFQQELKAVEMGLPMIGALTLGEIANTGDAYLEFYNKTSVVGILHDHNR
ncbi:FIST signal transduction protein [Desulfonatronum thioautotrophicum]|uniref:FIST signal transduction protein n=1 Tax=Desulfonatronum thioautotrophicum TaxID=617001 RepID=UPI0005EB7A34|nr:FIST N-terminal domain-containing protein [Desulfonatronum thioautotrophicum]